MGRLVGPAMAVAAAMVLAAPAATAEIRIGLGAVLSGDVSWIGEQHEFGVHRAVADINGRGGLLGQTVSLIALDDACQGEQGAAVAEQLVDENVVFVSGHTCSGASLAAAPIYEAAGILMISPSSTNPALTEAGWSYVFRVTGRDDEQGRVAGDLLADRWADRNIAIVHDSLAYGQRLAEETQLRLVERGIEGYVWYEWGDGQHARLE